MDKRRRNRNKQKYFERVVVFEKAYVGPIQIWFSVYMLTVPRFKNSNGE